MYMAEAGLDNPLNCGARQNATNHPSGSEFRYRRPQGGNAENCCLNLGCSF
jgi:hypothetical protein